MNSIQIECFIISAQTLNFTKTAQLLYISQPTVTHHIASLESELGFLLFERKNKQVYLTLAGEAFYNSVNRIKNDMDEAIIYAKNHIKQYEEKLCIGCGSSEFEKDFLPEIVSAFKEMYPQIYITFNIEFISKKVSLLSQGKIDILFSTTEMLLDSKSCDYRKVKEYPFVCVMHKNHKLAVKNNVGINDLNNQNLVLLEEEFAPPEMSMLQSQLELKYPNMTTHCHASPSISHLIIMCNMGVSVMPLFKYQPHESLVAIPYDWGTTVPYGIAKNKKDNRKYVKDFFELAYNKLQS